MERDKPPAGSSLTRAILLDIEGTTTPVDFVYQTLFPYACRHLEPFLREHSSDPDVRADLEALRREHSNDVEQGLNPPPWPGGPASEDPRTRRSQTAARDRSVADAVRHVHWLMDQDRKSTGLKSLEGKIWEAGYRSGALRGEVYNDVPRAFERWQRQGREIAIFSSGSVLAQKLLFSSTAAGDLTKFIRDYFDTRTGAKREAESYRRIAAALGLQPAEVLFVSDVAAELDAARATGMQTALCVRPGQPEPPATAHAVVRTFDEILP